MKTNNYKKDCIGHCIEWIKDHFIERLDEFGTLEEKLLFLDNVICQLYSNDKYTSDMDDAVFRCIKRRIQEALDFPNEMITPLLMENNNSENGRHVSRKLYYSEDGEGDCYR